MSDLQCAVADAIKSAMTEKDRKGGYMTWKQMAKVAIDTIEAHKGIKL